MIDRTLLCAPLLVPALLSVALWPADREAADVELAPAVVVEVARNADAATPVAAAAIAAPIPSADPVQAREPMHDGCTGKRRVTPATTTAAT